MSDVICECICHKFGALGCTGEKCTPDKLITETIFHEDFSNAK